MSVPSTDSKSDLVRGKTPPGDAAPHGHAGIVPLAMAALGIVYGDIGTSPLYAIKECFHGIHAVEATPANILGVLSLVFWSLMVVVSLKYVVFVLRADNKGEGGIFSLLSLLGGTRSGSDMGKRTFLILAAFGAALLYSDGVITPAISVLSAVEGLNVATMAASDFVVPITCGILFVLFWFQRHGTATIGRVFGPVMILWFLVLATLGLHQIIQQPGILAALNPIHALEFFSLNHWRGILVLGSVVLCITGGEALYADMGHFGRLPIRISWYTLVLPGLLLNYFGQGALLLDHPEVVSNPFYGLVPESLLYPMVALATMATIIASQAMISGVYSLTRQAIQLGLSPRMRIVHTSEQTMGQIYMPSVNTALMIACIGLVLAFKSSSNLAAAYGIAVTVDMNITSLLYFLLTRRVWNWPMWKSLPLYLLFLAFDFSFLGANLLKIPDGGWFTLTMASCIAIALTSWRDGRLLLAKHYRDSKVPVDIFLKDIERYNPFRSSGTAVFMSISPEGVPIPLLLNFKHNETIHERVILLTIQSTETPRVSNEDRLMVTDLGLGFYRVIARYGFMETPNIPRIMNMLTDRGIPADIPSTSFFLGRETLIPSGSGHMFEWRKRLFAYMSRNAWNVSSYFGVPAGQGIELGSRVNL